MNPYEFTKVEWWRSPNPTGLGTAAVGYCKNGDKYLTFDVRKIKGKEEYLPIFSSRCQVGGKYGHKEEAFKDYYRLFNTLKGYKIEKTNKLEYGVLDGREDYLFKTD